MRLVLDIDRSADGRMEGLVHPAGARLAMPFSGVLELLGIVEELFAHEAALGADGPAGWEQGRTAN